MQIEATMACGLLRVNIRLAVIETKAAKDDQCRENMERLYAGGSSEMAQLVWKTVWRCLKNTRIESGKYSSIHRVLV